MLLDAKAPEPPRGIRKYIPFRYLFPSLVVLLALGGILSYRFWNYRQERAVARFLSAVEEGKFREAYELWQPAPSYTYQDFLRDWGERGDYGKIREFRILGSKSRGASVIVTVRINDQDPPRDLLVVSKTLGLAFSPY